MSLANSNIVTSGLVFSYDMSNPKSWTGKPTTNYAYAQNARADSSYTSYSATGSGTWNAKHSDAIYANNIDGSDITGYVNTGVGDWTNTYHAIWTYDYELRKPVVTMRDIDGQWKAKSFGLSVSTPAGMGLSIGSTYSISWLSWTDDISKCANAGMYSRRASDGTYNFWDGQSNSQSTAFNTKPRTWQRVYAVYTVFSGMDINASWSCYMYGHYGNRGTVKIADVQIETGPPSGFSRTLTRSNTQALLDQTGNNTINAVSLTYNSDGTFRLDSSTPGYLDLSNDITIKTSGGWTVESWVKFTTVPGTYDNVYSPANFIGSESISYNSWYWSVLENKLALWNISPGVWKYGSTTLLPHRWYHCVLVCADSGTSYQMYLNGVPEGGDHTTYSWNASYAGLMVRYFGRGNSSNTRRLNGSLPVTKIYNRALSAAEVRQNYDALKERYFGYQTLTLVNGSNITLANNGTTSVTITKNADNNSWNGQAYSTEAFSAPCTIEFTKNAGTGDNGNSYAMIGWNTDPTTDSSYSSIDHAAYPFMQSTYHVYHNGSNVLASGVWDPNKRFYVVYDTDGYIRHYNGSTLLYSANYGIGNTVYLDSSLYNTDTTYCKFSDVTVCRKSWNGTQYV